MSMEELIKTAANNNERAEPIIRTFVANTPGSKARNVLEAAIDSNCKGYKLGNLILAKDNDADKILQHFGA